MPTIPQSTDKWTLHCEALCKAKGAAVTVLQKIFPNLSPALKNIHTVSL